MTQSIEQAPFGSTGDHSSRALFGAAALGAMSQERADRTLDLISHFGVNHIDVAASYGEAELRLAPWLARHRSEVFLATKTGHRTAVKARAQLHASLERMQVEQIDMIQLHNLTQEDDWQTAMGEGGALEALVEAKEQGLVRFIGVTGHGTYAPAMHIKSLETYAFDSILVPYSFVMMTNPQYAADFEALYELCTARGVAMQTIKSIAARRWNDDDPERRLSWYRPLKDSGAVQRAVDFVLARPGLFLNTSSDATLLEMMLQVAAAPRQEVDVEALQKDVIEHGIEPLFVRDVSDDVMIANG
ncbi:MAG: aldo/keto reductase [Gammaproteobacteria bacterium]|nr:aldo/keto reductase [Gammaproteobacteria bacterium]